jgi:hypothetical protein
MAGRYQGRHELRDMKGGHTQSIEVFWQQSGWFWRGLQTQGITVGPFTKSSQAYENALIAFRLSSPKAGRINYR